MGTEGKAKSVHTKREKERERERTRDHIPRDSRHIKRRIQVHRSTQFCTYVYLYVYQDIGKTFS